METNRKKIWGGGECRKLVQNQEKWSEIIMASKTLR